MNSINLIVMGPSRAGKSSFLNNLAGEQICKVGAPFTYTGTTKKVKGYDFMVRETKVTVVDTIGFDDPEVQFSNKEIQ